MSQKKLPPLQEFLKLSDKDKEVLFNEFHYKKNLSVSAMAEEMGTYPNRLYRLLKRLGIQRRSASDAQRIALSSGKREHPTEGKPVPDEVKAKMGKSKLENWRNLSDKEKEEFRKKQQEIWNSRATKPHQSPKKQEGLKKAAQSGSKLELFVYNELKNRGYIVEHQKEHFLKKDTFHTDLYLKDFNTIIEIDGPAHHTDIFGQNKLTKSQIRDAEKNNLVIHNGMYMIRAINDKRFTPTYGKELVDALEDILVKIKKGKINQKKVIECKIV